MPIDGSELILITSYYAIKGIQMISANIPEEKRLTPSPKHRKSRKTQSRLTEIVADLVADGFDGVELLNAFLRVSGKIQNVPIESVRSILPVVLKCLGRLMSCMVTQEHWEEDDELISVIETIYNICTSF